MRMFLSLSGHILRQGILAQEKLNASKSNSYPGKESGGLANGTKSENLVSAGVYISLFHCECLCTIVPLLLVCQLSDCIIEGYMIAEFLFVGKIIAESA